MESDPTFPSNLNPLALFGKKSSPIVRRITTLMHLGETVYADEKHVAELLGFTGGMKRIREEGNTPADDERARPELCARVLVTAD
jgi:hypothetical protein